MPISKPTCTWGWVDWFFYCSIILSSRPVSSTLAQLGRQLDIKTHGNQKPRSAGDHQCHLVIVIWYYPRIRVQGRNFSLFGIPILDSLKSIAFDRYLCEPCLGPGCISLLRHDEDKSKHIHQYRKVLNSIRNFWICPPLTYETKNLDSCFLYSIGSASQWLLTWYCSNLSEDDLKGFDKGPKSQEWIFTREFVLTFS